MQFQAGFLALCFALRGVAALYTLPEPPVRRAVQADVFDGLQSGVLKRSTHEGTFSLDFDAKNKVLAKGHVQGIDLDVKCANCHTTGNITTSAMLPSLGDIFKDPTDIFHDSVLGLTFNGVSASLDLGLSVGSTGNVTLPLFKSESPVGIDGPGFEIGVIFEVDLILTVTGEIETDGGFMVDIPDGSTFMIPVDDSKPNVANFQGSSVSLLPVTADISADVTVALRLTVQAGIMLPDLKIFDATAVVGAFLSIPEVILTGAVSVGETECHVPVTADLNINAGVFVDIGAEVDGHTIGDFKPTASTTLFAASTSTCLASPTSSAAKSTASAGKTSSKTSSAAATSTAYSSFSVYASGRPTTLATTRKSSAASMPTHFPSSAGRNSTVAIGTPSSYPIIVDLAAVRHGYDITMTKLEHPITKFVAAATPTSSVA